MKNNRLIVKIKNSIFCLRNTNNYIETTSANDYVIYDILFLAI